LAEAKRLPVDFLEGLGVRDRPGGGVEISYRDLTSKTITSRTRDTLAGRPVWPKGQRAIVYGEDRLHEAIEAGYLVLVEGESDCWTLWHHGLPALGIPGAECTKTLQLGHIAQLKTTYVVQENDAGGETFLDRVRHRLAALGWTGEVRRVYLGQYKDPSALHVADPRQFPERWRRAMEEADMLDVRVIAIPASSLSITPPWPDPLGEEAFHGLIGDLARVLEPASEADPAALLLQALVGFGNVIGRSAHFKVEADLHFGNEFAVMVGKTSKARKGTSRGRIHRLLTEAEEEWAKERVQTGLSSGEGLIWGVRDKIMKRERVKERGQPVRYEEVEADPGVGDKRLLIIEPEFANILKQTERQGNTLSAVLRQAWESGDLRTLTKNSPARATGAHVSMIGHVTTEELRRYLSATEQANGFGNRIMWQCVKRSKNLPEGGRLDEASLADIRQRLVRAIEFARSTGEMGRDEEAREVWRDAYDLPLAITSDCGRLKAIRKKPDGREASVGVRALHIDGHAMRTTDDAAIRTRSPAANVGHTGG
jgi:hypothetical protein